MSDHVATVRLDYSGLKKQVKALTLQSSRSVPEVINQVGLNAVGRGFNATPRADKTRIQTSLGQIVKANRITKKGKIATTKRFVATNFFNQGPRLALIINARRARRGLPGLEGKDMERAAMKALGGRLRSVGFEASGWVPGMKTMIRSLKRPFIIARLSGVSVYKRPKGEAKPAREGFRSVATLINNVKGIDKVGQRALQRGIDEESREIGRHLEEEMDPHAKEFNDRSKH